MTTLFENRPKAHLLNNIKEGDVDLSLGEGLSYLVHVKLSILPLKLV